VKAIATVQPGDGPPSGFAQRYWFAWLAIFITAFLVYEVFSLATGHPENTLSNFIWTHLKIHAGESITQWSAGDLLTFCVYITVFVAWLPWHFWLERFR
jgi:hypothetical protein